MIEACLMLINYGSFEYVDKVVGFALGYIDLGLRSNTKDLLNLFD